VNKQAFFSAYFGCSLSYCLQKRLTFNIADRSADLGYDDIGVVDFADTVDAMLYLIRDVRYYLNRLTEILSGTFLGKYIVIYTPGGDI